MFRVSKSIGVEQIQHKSPSRFRRVRNLAARFPALVRLRRLRLPVWRLGAECCSCGVMQPISDGSRPLSVFPPCSFLWLLLADSAHLRSMRIRPLRSRRRPIMFCPQIGQVLFWIVSLFAAIIGAAYQKRRSFFLIADAVVNSPTISPYFFLVAHITFPNSMLFVLLGICSVLIAYIYFAANALIHPVIPSDGEASPRARNQSTRVSANT